MAAPHQGVRWGLQQGQRQGPRQRLCWVPARQRAAVRPRAAGLHRRQKPSRLSLCGAGKRGPSLPPRLCREPSLGRKKHGAAR